MLIYLTLALKGLSFCGYYSHIQKL